MNTATARPPDADDETRLQIIAALTGNDLRAMSTDFLTDEIIAKMTVGQMHSVLRFMAGASPDFLAKAIRHYAYADPWRLS